MIDLTGMKYGRLTVVEFDRLQNHKTYWKCVCDCGLTVIATGNNLRSGNTSSCGCLRRETTSQRGIANMKHGESHSNRTRLYSIWCGMRQRCENPNRTAYKLYGGKGVSVCDEWNLSCIVIEIIKDPDQRVMHLLVYRNLNELIIL